MPHESSPLSPPNVELRIAGKRDLQHIPGPNGFQIPIVNTVKFLKDPLASAREMYQTYGPVFRNRTFGGWRVGLLGPEANKFVLMNNDNVFSSELGWAPLIGRIFPRGLMLLDFDEHRLHRRMLQPAFRADAMEQHCSAINKLYAERLKNWPTRQTMLAYPAVKQLTLDLAARIFVGLELSDHIRLLNDAFQDMIKATTGLVRHPLPGSKMWRGVKGKKYIADFLESEIPRRRTADCNDLFTSLCQATDETGTIYTNQTIIDHLNFFLVAAHDTMTSTITAMMYYLGKYPDWQELVREEILQFAPDGDGIAICTLPKLVITEKVFMETLRLNPPIPGIPRVAVKPFEFQGYQLPAGTQVGINPLFTHRMEAIWNNPDEFNPDNFTKQRIAQRHSYAWIPFSGGMHKCLGFHLANMEAKLFFAHLLSNFRIKLSDGYECHFKAWPLAKPIDDLPLELIPL